MEEIPIDGSLNDSEDQFQRLRNISEMFNGNMVEDNRVDRKEDKFEILPSSEKLKRTFQKFEEFVASNGRYESDDDDEDSSSSTNGTKHRSSQKQRAPKEHIPYHEMAEVKDKFEKGLIDSNKVRIEKRLDIRVQSGLASSKKQAFEQGLIEQDSENQKIKSSIECELIAGLASTNKKVFEQQQQTEPNQRRKSSLIEHELLLSAAREKKALYETVLNQDRTKVSNGTQEIATIAGTGLAQAKRDELLSKIDGETNQRSSTKPTDIDAEQGLATTRRDQLASLINSEFKAQEKIIDVTAGLTNVIKEQYIADANRSSNVSSSKPTDIETGLAKNLATVFEKPDETNVKRTINMEQDLTECAVAKERLAMFKNLQNGSQTTNIISSNEAKLRVDENGNIVRETDKREEIYFEKGQTKQLVEQWKSKQLSPERDVSDGQTSQDSEILEQGKARNLLEMWKTIDKENSPPTSRRAPRAMTPPTEDEIPIESGHAKAIRERLLQSAESATKRSSRQITPPPLSSDEVRRKFSVSSDERPNPMESSIFDEEFLPSKGQAKSLKNRFIELEQDAMKVETAASKIKYVPKRFVSKPVAKPKVPEPTSTEKIEQGNNEYYLTSTSQ